VIIRSAPRFAVSLLVAFSGDQDGVGVIKNLSINGCCISSGSVVRAREALNLEFHPRDDGPVILVDLAEVHWATPGNSGSCSNPCYLRSNNAPPYSRSGSSELSRQRSVLDDNIAFRQQPAP
jgi:hypothetical protein